MHDPQPLLQSIQTSQAGITLAELLRLHTNVPKRTAQRWVQQFILRGLVIAEGRGPARHYFPTPNKLASEIAPESDAFPDYIPLSLGAREVLSYVAQPIAARTAVGYQREFLDAYQPNQTWYLSASQRRQLHHLGDTGQKNRLAGTYARAIYARLLVDLSWASSQLEGNTYSRLDTEALIAHEKTAHGKTVFETQMILNHKRAIDLLVDNSDNVNFNRYTLLNLHSILSENLLINPADEGRIRLHEVEIGKSVYHPLILSSLLEASFDLILKKALQITDPFEQSFFMMVHLPYLQPFADVNKRTSRLAANLPLIKNNLCPLTFLHVTEAAYSRAVLGVYELTRIDLLRDLYVWAYERSAQEYLVIKQNMAEPDPLRLAYREVIQYIIHEVVTQLDQDEQTLIRDLVQKQVKPNDQQAVEALVTETLSRLNEGVLMRYGLHPSAYLAWKAKQQGHFRGRS